MIKLFDENSPEEQAFLEYVQKLRSQPPKPLPDPGPPNWDEIHAIIAEVSQEDRDDLVETILEGRKR